MARKQKTYKKNHRKRRYSRRRHMKGGSILGDLANNFVSEGHSKFCSPLINRSTHGFMSSYSCKGTNFRKSWYSLILLKLLFFPQTVGDAVLINFFKVSF